MCKKPRWCSRFLFQDHDQTSDFNSEGGHVVFVKILITPAVFKRPVPIDLFCLHRRIIAVAILVQDGADKGITPCDSQCCVFCSLYAFNQSVYDVVHHIQNSLQCTWPGHEVCFQQCTIIRKLDLRCTTKPLRIVVQRLRFNGINPMIVVVRSLE